MQQEPLGNWLDALASAAPAPGGGAVAALHTAMAAGLVEMVCNLTIGKPKYADHEPTMIEARGQATRLRAEALQLAADDAAAFSAVVQAYKLPKDTEEQRAEKTRSIQSALVGAAEVPVRTALAASSVLELALRILDGANVNVISDIAVAASSVRAALESAIVNIDINRGAITDSDQRATLDTAVQRIEQDLERCSALVASVRKRISQ